MSYSGNFSVREVVGCPMRTLRYALIGIAITVGLAAQATGQNLPSDVEQRMGIRPNSANPERDRGDRYEGRGRYSYDDDRLARCQSRAHRRGLAGGHFRRFVLDCMER